MPVLAPAYGADASGIAARNILTPRNKIFHNTLARKSYSAVLSVTIADCTDDYDRTLHTIESDQPIIHPGVQNSCLFANFEITHYCNFAVHGVKLYWERRTWEPKHRLSHIFAV